MTTYKGSGIFFVREHIEQVGPDALAQLDDRLQPEDRELMRMALAIDWIAVEQVDRVFRAAAALSFPGDEAALRQLGRAQCKHDLTGIYRTLVRLVSVGSVIERTSKLWTRYYSAGRPSSILGPEPNTATLVVEDFPELPEGMREVVAGFVEQVVELTGARRARVQANYAKPMRWSWTVRWE